MNNTSVSFTFPTIPILGLIFVTLKLCGVIHWPWFWVLAPFWMSFCFGLVVIGVAVLIFAIVFSRKRKRR